MKTGRVKVLGAIIAGGKSSRMGGVEKPFLKLNNQTLLAHIVTRISPQVDHIVVNANGTAARFDLPVVPDLLTALQTPLVGLHAVLAYAQNFDAVLTVPGDGPFLPHDLCERLKPGPAIARSREQDHYLTGLWPANLFSKLDDAIIKGGMVRMQDWVAACGAAKVSWPVQSPDPFFNINTPEDLALAQSWAQP